jgi:hypothetical protein
MKCVLISIAFCGIIFLSSCDLFSLRDPEPPIDTQSSWIPPVSWDLVLVNFQNAILEKNIENFIRCFANPTFSDSTFHFDADPEVAAIHPEIFEAWSLDHERVVLQQMFSYIPEDSASAVIFTDDEWQTEIPDHVVFSGNYTLELHHTHGIWDRFYFGFLEFHMTTDQRGEWSIYRWIDDGIAGSPSWSELKAALGG